MKRHAVMLSILVACCAPDRTPTGPSGSPAATAGSPIRVLMLTSTAGYRHDSIPTARDVTSRLAPAEIRVTSTEDLSMITAGGLQEYDVLFFALTSGELALSADQKAAIMGFVSGGKGFLGAHSATDTLYGWPDYGGLIGAYFKEHPWTEEATVIVEDQSHPTTIGLGERFSLIEEFYTFRENPRPRVHVLLRLDSASVGSSGDYPLAWAHEYGSGRVYYNALGHFPATWQDSRFQQQLLNAIRWVARR